MAYWVDRSWMFGQILGLSRRNIGIFYARFTVRTVKPIVRIGTLGTTILGGLFT